MTGRERIVTRFADTEDGSCSLCGGSSDNIKEEDFKVISLQVNRMSSARNIQDLLKATFDSPTTPFSRRCDLCQESDVDDILKKNAFSTRSIASLPTNLFIQIPKFDYNERLIGKLIVPETELDFDVQSGGSGQSHWTLRQVGSLRVSCQEWRQLDYS